MPRPFQYLTYLSRRDPLSWVLFVAVRLAIIGIVALIASCASGSGPGSGAAAAHNGAPVECSTVNRIGHCPNPLGGSH